MNQLPSIKLKPTTIKQLRKLKLIPRETDDDVVQRLLNLHKEARNAEKVRK